jgi:predicted small metal-binding protein
MAQETFKELVCGEDGFRVRAKTEAEVLKHVKTHVMDAHGAKEITPDMEKNLKSRIKDVSV